MRASRVVVVSHTAELGGGELALLRLLDAVDRDSFELSAVLFEEGALAQLLTERGIAVEALRLGRLNSMTRQQSASPRALWGSAADATSFVRVLASSLRRQQPDLLVANTLKAAIMLSVVAPLVATPWVWHLHDRLADDYLPRLPASALRSMAAVMPRCVIVNSEATLKTLGRRGRTRARVAYPGLDAAAFTDNSGGTPIASEQGAIGILGRISQTKGQLEFVAAASVLAAKHPDSRFRIIGSALFRDGDYEVRLREAVEAAALGDRLTLEGWSTEPAATIRSLRLLVHASAVPEPFGQVVVEAMAAGTPVVATDAGGIPEILDPSGHSVRIADGVRRTPLGTLVRPGDPHALAAAMAWALENPDELATMATAARLSAAGRFAIDKTRSVVEPVWKATARPERISARGRRSASVAINQSNPEG